MGGTHEEAWRFFVMLTDSRLSTVSSVWLLSRILRYAASVSWMVLSYSFREATSRASLSLSWLRRFVSTARSFWIFVFSCSSEEICLLISSRFSRRSSIPAQSCLSAPCRGKRRQPAGARNGPPHTAGRLRLMDGAGKYTDGGRFWGKGTGERAGCPPRENRLQSPSGTRRDDHARRRAPLPPLCFCREEGGLRPQSTPPRPRGRGLAPPHARGRIMRGGAGARERRGGASAAPSSNACLGLGLHPSPGARARPWHEGPSRGQGCLDR